jgi:arylsulfatase A-like enzyme
MDAARADGLSLYGHPGGTSPHLESLAAEGVVFDRAFATAPWTPPSHASMFTGLYPSRHGVDVGENLALPAGVGVLPEILEAHGYRTFGFLPDVHLSSRRGFHRGFQEYLELWRLPYWHPEADWLRCLGWNALFGRDRRARYTSAVLRRWIRAAAGDDRPFFIFANFKTPHAPYHRLPRAARRRFEDAWPGVDRRRAEAYSRNGGYSYMAGRLDVGPAEMALVRSWYAAALAYTDAQIGALVATLREAGVQEDTLLVVTADHGENFGEHGLAYHLFCLYDTLLRVPLVMSCPGRLPAGRRLGRLTSLADLLPTIADVLDLPHGLQALDGRSAAPFTDEDGPDEVFAEFGRPRYMLERLTRQFPGHDFSRFDRGLQCVRTARHKFVQATDGGEELYDLEVDPDERQNLVTAQPALAADLRTRLDRWRAGPAAGRSRREPAAVTAEDDATVVKALADLGYF